MFIEIIGNLIVLIGPEVYKLVGYSSNASNIDKLGNQLGIISIIIMVSLTLIIGIKMQIEKNMRDEENRRFYENQAKENTLRKEKEVKDLKEKLKITNDMKYTPQELFTFDSIKKSITYFKDIGLSKVIVPAKINGIDIISIGVSAFKDKNITEIVLPNGIKTIWYEAFADNKIENLIIPDSIVRIDTKSFANNKIRTLKLSNGLQEIGTDAFRGNLITNLRLPDSVIKIRNGAFANNLISTLKLSDSLTWIGMYAFNNNYLKEVTIPFSVSALGTYAFSNNRIAKLNLARKSHYLDENVFTGNPIDNKDFQQKQIEIRKENQSRRNASANDWEGIGVGIDNFLNEIGRKADTKFKTVVNNLDSLENGFFYNCPHCEATNIIDIREGYMPISLHCYECDCSSTVTVDDLDFSQRDKYIKVCKRLFKREDEMNEIENRTAGNRDYVENDSVVIQSNRTIFKTNDIERNPKAYTKTENKQFNNRAAHEKQKQTLTTESIEKKLAFRELYENGIITEEDFNKKIIAISELHVPTIHIQEQEIVEMGVAEEKEKNIEEALKTIRNLFDEGLISESDYNKKKEELLKRL